MSEPATKRRKRRGERADGRILVTLAIGYTPEGKVKRKYFYGRTRAEAEQKRAQYIQLQTYGIAADKDAMTVNQWINEWLVKYKSHINPAYASAFNVPVKRLRKQLGDRRIRSIIESDLVAALDTVRNMSDSTIKKYAVVIKQVFQTAYRNHIIASDPTVGLTPPTGKTGSHRALEKWETETILNNWHKHRAGLWVMLMLLCGLRRGELIALDWDNVDIEHRQIHVKQSAVIVVNQSQIKVGAKTAAGVRSIPICDALYNALCTVPEESRHGYVCHSANNELLTQSAFERGWDGFCLAMQRILNNEPLYQAGKHKTLAKRMAEANAAGRNYILFRIRAHDLRHTFATALYDAGIDVKTAQYYLGHSDTRMTIDLYTHLSKEHENAKRGQLTSFLDGWLNGMNYPTIIQPANNLVDNP